MATSTPVNCNSTGSHKFRVYVTNASDNGTATNTTYKRSLTTRGEFYNNAKSTWSPSGTVVTTFTPNKTFSYDSSITTQTVTSNFSSVNVAAKSTDYSKTTSSYNHAATFNKACESYTITNKTVGTVSSYTTTYTGSAVTIAARTKYTITYNLNKTGAVHATGYQTYCTACGGDHKSYGYSARVYTNSSGTGLTPTCTGYKFLGWSTSSTATTPMYYSGDTYSTNADLTLYGVWQEAYTIAVRPFSGGSMIGGTVTGGGTYNYGDTVTITATPGTDYVFVGWWKGTSMGGDTQVSTNSTYTFTCTGSASYWAHFHLNKTTVTLNLNGGTGAIVAKPTYSYETSGTFAGGSTYLSYPLGHTAEDPNTYTSNVYASSGSTAYATYSFDFSSVPSDATNISVEVKCNGRRENSTDDSTHMANLDLYTGTTLKVSSKFTSDAEETVTINGGTWTRAQLLDAKLRFTVAYYGGRLYGITWKVTYTSSTNLTEKFTYGEITNNIVAKGTGNGGFIGWYTSSSGGTQVFDSNGKWVSGTYWNSSGQWNYQASSLTLYAHWQTYTLTVDANSGSVPSTSGWIPSGGASSQKSKTVWVGMDYSDCGYLPIPTRTNYAFEGWYSSASGGNQFTSSDGVITDAYSAAVDNYYDWETGDWIGTSNLTLYAHWIYDGEYTLYVKTDQGWKKGIVYVKTSSGWKQGTPYIKTTNGWKQGN